MGGLVRELLAIRVNNLKGQRNEAGSNEESPEEINAARIDREEAERLRREKTELIRWRGNERNDNPIVETRNNYFHNDQNNNENQQNQGGYESQFNYYNAINQQLYYNDNK